MTRLTTLLFFAFISCAPVAAQCRLTSSSLEKMNDEESTLLLRAFKLPETATISEVKVKIFPSDVPVKVNLETIYDPPVRQLVKDWITEWNQKEGEKYGKLDIAPDSLGADVSVVRYSQVPATGILSKLVSKGGLACFDSNGNQQILVPIYSYLIVQKSDGLEILWRKAYLTYLEEREFMPKLLTDQLKKLMKNRAKD